MRTGGALVNRLLLFLQIPTKYLRGFLLAVSNSQLCLLLGEGGV